MAELGFEARLQMDSRSVGHALITVMFPRTSPTKSGGLDSSPRPASEKWTTLNGVQDSPGSDIPGLYVWGGALERAWGMFYYLEPSRGPLLTSPHKSLVFSITQPSLLKMDHTLQHFYDVRSSIPIL